MSGSKYHKNWTIIGLPAKRHLNGVSLACRWWPNIECWPGSFVIFQGIRTGIAKKPSIFVIFQGDPEPLSPLWIRTWDLSKFDQKDLQFPTFLRTLIENPQHKMAPFNLAYTWTKEIRHMKNACFLVNWPPGRPIETRNNPSIYILSLYPNLLKRALYTVNT